MPRISFSGFEEVLGAYELSSFILSCITGPLIVDAGAPLVVQYN